MAVVRVYVDDETYEKLEALSKEKGSSITQIAGQILRDKFDQKQAMEEMADILQTIIENQQQITSLLDEHHKTLFEAFKYLYWTLAKTGIAVREYTNIKVNTDEVKKAVNQAVNGVKEKVKEGE